MKTLRFFGMMLMAVLMSFNMTACGDDDDDSGDGGSTGGSYVGTWIDTDRSDKMVVITIGTSSWQRDEYRCRENVYTKNTIKGSLSVSGNVITINGEAPFKTATYSVSDNTMTIKIQESTNKEMDEEIQLTRATADDLKRIAAWETAVLASQNAK